MQGLFNVIKDIIGMFKAHGNADQSRFDADSLSLFLTQLGVSGRCGVGHNRAGVTQIGRTG
jgi:hypothetical protein